MFKNKKQKGFTLIELLIVITIIGVLAAIAIPKFTQNKAASEKAACQANLSTLESAIERYNYDNTTALADSTAAQISTALTGGTTKYIRRMPTCPTSGGTYSYTAASGMACSISGHSL